MRTSRFLLFLALVCAPTISSAKAVKIGVGAQTCAKFAQDYAVDTRVEETYYTWAQGFISSQNLTHSANHGEGSEVDLVPEGVTEAWHKSVIREYCALNPLKPYTMAVLVLMQKLAEESARGK